MTTMLDQDAGELLAPELLGDVDQAAGAGGTGEGSAGAGQDYDPEAPHGRKPDGTPYKRPAEWRAKLADRLAQGRATQAAKVPPKKRTTGKGASGSSRAAQAASVDYRGAVMGLAQLATFTLGMLGRFNQAFALDAATISLHAPALAEAVDQTAQVDERLAAVLDRVMVVGPYGAIIGAGLAIGLQVAANHGAIAANPDVGILTPDQLVSALEERASQSQ